MNVLEIEDNHLNNPEFNIIQVKDEYYHKSFYVFDDSSLAAGTKSRAGVKTLLYFIRNHRKKYGLKKTDTLHLHGLFAPSGFGQISFAYSIHRLKDENIVGHNHTLLYKTDKEMKLLKMAEKYGGCISKHQNESLIEKIELDNEIGSTYYYMYDMPKLYNVHDYIKEEIEKNKKSHEENIFLGTGLDTPEFSKILAKQIIKALPKSFDRMKEMTIWVTASTGSIMIALYEVFPNAFFNSVQVGISSAQQKLDKSRTKHWIYKSPFQENVRNVNKPPYNSMLNYDAKVWYFARRFGKTGDYVWNVAGEPK
jgi:hypothetical protein